MRRILKHAAKSVLRAANACQPLLNASSVPSSLMKLIQQGDIQRPYFLQRPRNLFETLHVLPRFGVGYRLFPLWRLAAEMPAACSYYLISRVRPEWHMQVGKIYAQKMVKGRAIGKETKIELGDALRTPWTLYYDEKDKGMVRLRDALNPHLAPNVVEQAMKMEKELADKLVNTELVSVEGRLVWRKETEEVKGTRRLRVKGDLRSLRKTAE